MPRRSVGPSLRDLMVGSEGTLGIITELTLRIWKKPEIERGVVLAFPSLDAAWASAPPDHAGGTATHHRAHL